jgi:hypothetical protein
MNSKNKKLARQELEKIYESRSALLKNSKALRKRFSESLEKNPELKVILFLSVLGNIGIWIGVFLLSSSLL